MHMKMPRMRILMRILKYTQTQIAITTVTMTLSRESRYIYCGITFAERPSLDHRFLRKNLPNYRQV
ncbi:hypothetical protein DPMN_100444 [Dreissena polymorpha]|uniref:Uncharacterized protein n=1 Tax=Dreissena polymorpha TaxID=45954 RepID=A0A9D4LHF0_DREPO|nr:hypothetical protein DPMN_100444 [Dreissena polymorpha]